MADSAKPKCGTCSIQGEAQTVAATDPCATQTECTTPVDPCEEDHTQTICDTKFATTLKVTNTFNFPAIGEFASLTLEGVTSLLPGSILWNRTVGRLYVESFDVATGVAVVTNKGDSCDTSAKTPGDSVPACTEFNLGIPECNSGGAINNSDVFPYLAADFVAPANGSCGLASVTNVVGISVNDIVSINTFLYRVKSIPDANTIELCNEGDGAPTGQVIRFDPNCDEVPDVQVISVSSDDPCSRDGINSGVILVCDSGVAQPLIGTADSQVAVWDNNLEKFVLKTMNVPDACSSLTTCLVVDTGNAGPYLIIVADSSIFGVGNRLDIDGDVFVVTEIVSPTQIRATADVVPTAPKEYAIGTTVCIQDCCIDLPDRVTAIEEVLNDPCFDKRLLPPALIPFASQNLNFQPTETSPGVYQQYYDIGDPALPGDLVSHQLVLPADGCSYYVEAFAFLTIVATATKANFAPTDPIASLRQLHDFVLAVDGEYTDSEARAVHSSKGQGDDVVDFVSNPAPANFLLNSYGWMNRETLVMYREMTVNAANGAVNSPVFSIGHRLALGDNRNSVNWGANSNRIEWDIVGQLLIKAHLRKDIP